MEKITNYFPQSVYDFRRKVLCSHLTEYSLEADIWVPKDRTLKSLSNNVDFYSAPVKYFLVCNKGLQNGTGDFFTGGSKWI